MDHHYEKKETQHGQQDSTATMDHNSSSHAAAGMVEIDTHLLSSSAASNCQQQPSSHLHRRRTLYLVRHGEALHNVKEAAAQAAAKIECHKLGLSQEETWQKMEEARQAVLQDTTLRDAPLTEKGRQQAAACAQKLQDIIIDKNLVPPTEAMVSPLTRTLETCDILLEKVQLHQIKAHVRPELQERQTQYPPDTARSRRSILKYSQTTDSLSLSQFHYHDYQVTAQDIQNETKLRESKEMLRARATKLFDLLMEIEHRHVLIVSHKGYLRELERGLLGLSEDKSPLFGNAELRVYRVVFTKGDRTLEQLERVV